MKCFSHKSGSCLPQVLDLFCLLKELFCLLKELFCLLKELFCLLKDLCEIVGYL